MEELLDRKIKGNRSALAYALDRVLCEHHRSGDSRLPPSGLCGARNFFEAVERFLAADDGETTWCVLSIDIENMKLFNKWYGWEAGNALIAGICDYLLQARMRLGGIAGYLGDDDFALLMPHDKKKIEELYHGISDLLFSCGNKVGFLPALGVYIVTDRAVPAQDMYDWAEFARDKVRGNYLNRIATFDPVMLENLETKIRLYSDVRKALAEREFTFYLQPKCNMENGKLVGAEALVRWISPERGAVSPGVFIPFLEKTGFITELDVYIWEAVCKWQRYCLDRGIPTVPISVNVSRADLYATDVPAFFREMIKKYDLKPRMIELEITESIYSDRSDYINAIVTELRSAGFRVLMDDFGSGYSSLNMLKDIELDVLKVDMRFLEIDESNIRKGIGILEAVHNMAQLMGLDVIVEGVETELQKDFLLKMGCGYGQGYYFYRPMPTEEFELLLRDGRNLDDKGFQDRRIERMVLKDLLSEDMFSEVMLNNMLGAVVFYEYCDGRLNIRRYNENYANLLGISTQVDMKMDLMDRLRKTDYEKMLRLLDTARLNRNEGATGDIRRLREDGSDQWVRLRVFFLREQDGHAVYYSSLSDVTDIHLQNQSLAEMNEALLEREWQQQKYKSLAEIPGMLVYDYDPAQDQLTVERALLDGTIDTMMVEKFIENIEDHPWLSRENVANQRRELQAALEHQSNGSTVFKARFPGEKDYCWYRSYLKSIADETGKVYRLVGRADKLQDENKWMDGPVSRTVLDLPVQENQLILEYANNETLVNEGLRLALAQSDPDESLHVLLAHLGQRLQSDRMYIFEEQPDGTVRNTYEWCNEGVTVQKDALQNVPFSAVELWYRSFHENRNVIVQDLEATRESDPQAYEYLKPQNIQSLVVSPIVNGDRGIVGFFGVDNVPPALLSHISVLMEIVGHFISSLLRRRDMANKLRLRSYYDQLTGLKNRHAMDVYIAGLKMGGPLGVFYLDVMGLKRVNDALGHHAGDELLKRVGSCLRETFGVDATFRLGGDEFLVLCDGMAGDERASLLERLRTVQEKYEVHLAVGSVWEQRYDGDFDRMMRAADDLMYQDKRALYGERQ